MSSTLPSVVHVTHEAIHKIGGIGAVLQGLFTSRAFVDGTNRNLLVGPFWPSDDRGENRLGSDGEVLYSSLDGLSRTPLAAKFREVEDAFGVGIVYGRRRFVDKATGVASVPEILLIDVAREYNKEKLGHFKFQLWQTFGIASGRYEHIWDYEQWVRLAQPALAAVHALGLTATAQQPCVILSHEYMGMPTCLAAILENGRGNFRTVFHAHECAPMRRICEGHPGHDTMFYNAMRTAMASGQYVDDVFGDQSDFYKAALVKATKYCDNIFAVGDYTLKEMRFLGPEFASVQAQLAYNGVPCWRITADEKMRSREKLRRYCKALLKYEPDYVFTHVTRLVMSKGLWRDLRVLEHLELRLRERGETAVLFALTTEVPGRRPDDVRRMEQQYRWPVVHREGHPDLSGGEAVYYQGVQEFNAQSRNVKVVFVNQFGFTQQVCGQRMPADMEFMDIRKGSDAEFGQSIYEPFGIAQVEPISFGGICVFSECCGCAGFVEKAAAEAGLAHNPNVIVADYTELPGGPLPAHQVLAIGQPQRDAVEAAVAKKVADTLYERLPRTPEQFQQFIDRGYALAQHMSWDAVARNYILPGFERAVRAKRLAQIA